MTTIYIARYRDPFGRWQRHPVRAASPAEALEKATRRFGNCAGVSLK